jgi:hypothetical protein
MLVDSLRVVEESPVIGVAKEKSMIQPGELVPIVGVVRWTTNNHIRIGSLNASISAAPAGGSVVAHLKKNGSTIATITIPANSVGVNVTTFVGNGADAQPNDYFTLDVVSVGSVVPGSNLKVQINYVETED